MFTYIISNGAAVEIGRSTNVRTRLSELQTSSHTQLELVCVIERDIESQLHHQFKDDRQRGEWFTFSNAIREFIITERDALYKRWIAHNFTIESADISLVELDTPDPWIELLRPILDALPVHNNGQRYITNRVTLEFLGVDYETRDRTGSLRLTPVMRSLGYVRTRMRDECKIVMGFVSAMPHTPSTTTDES